MSIIWTIGGIFFWFAYERKGLSDKIVPFEDKPSVTILVPCYNESETIEETCKRLLYINYPNYKVLFINDSSTDNTAELIDKFTLKVPRFKQIKLAQNAGKANALNIGLASVDTPLVLVLDADTILDRDSLNYFIKPFIQKKNIGAVTGNVLLIDKSSNLAKFQAAEFTCIIGLIKRCQHVLGTLFTISGCATMFSTEALLKSGGFSTKTATDDVDVTWRIQRIFYKALFEPMAKAFIQVPTNIMQYVKQRKRWATGGWHLLRQHKDIFRNNKLKNLWVVYLEFAASCIWAFAFAITTIWWITTVNIYKLPQLEINLGWTGAIASFIFVIQAIVAIAINNKYDMALKKCFFWICWYPLIFFAVGIVLIIWTAPAGLFRPTDFSGTWSSPPRDPSQTLNTNDS